MIHPQHLRLYVIRPAFQVAGLWCDASEELILGVAAVESDMGTYLSQKSLTHGKGGLGIFQMERKTHNDLWSRMHVNERDTVLAVCNMAMASDADRMCWDLRYAALMTRYFFKKFPEPLPNHKDLKGLAQYWKDYYNTALGKGKTEDYVKKYRDYVERFKNESL